MRVLALVRTALSHRSQPAPDIVWIDEEQGDDDTCVIMDITSIMDIIKLLRYTSKVVRVADSGGVKVDPVALFMATLISQIECRLDMPDMAEHDKLRRIWEQRK